MGVVPYVAPAAYLGATADAPMILEAAVTAGQTINEGDFVVIPSGTGTISRAATGTNTNIAGVSIQSSGAVYYAGPGGSAAALSPQSFFGASQAGQLYPGTVKNTKYYSLGTGDYIEMSLVQPWALTLVGASIGLTLDPTTNLFVADTTQAAIATILRLKEGPLNAQAIGVGGVGDTGARVLVRLISSTLAN